MVKKITGYDDGWVRRVETRYCEDIHCHNEMTVHIDDPSDDEVEAAFRDGGWKGYQCPTHAR